MAFNELRCNVTCEYKHIRIEGVSTAKEACNYLTNLLKEFPEYEDYNVFVYTYDAPLKAPIAPPQCDFGDSEIRG